MEFTIIRLKLPLAFIFALSIIFGGISQVKAQEIKDPLTLEMLITGLKSTSSGASLATKNEFIKLRVNELGVDFPWTWQTEKELREAGADVSLIAVIRRKAPQVVDEKRRAEARIRREKRRQEIIKYTKAIEANPKDSDSYKKRAFLYGVQADYELAIDDYVRVLQIDPGDTNAKFRLKMGLDRVGRYMYFPARRRRDDPRSRNNGFAKGTISKGFPKRRARFLSQPFSRREPGYSKRKTQVYILTFVDPQGRVTSAIDLSMGFSNGRAALQAAKTSSFAELRESSQRWDQDWVIIIYEFEG